MRLALIVAALFVLPFGAAVPASANGDWAALHRPLQLKPLQAGARCPVTRSHRLDHGRLSGVGAGPVFAMPAPFGPDDRHPGWIGSKTLWTWPAKLLTQNTRVLVRGRRLDQNGVMRFQLGPNWDTPLRSELRIATNDPVGSFSDSTWGATVTLLFVRKPGCYGIQLDTHQGTSIIVLAA